VMYVLHHADQPQLYANLPEQPKISALVGLWKGATKPLALFAIVATAFAGFLHYIGIGANETTEADEAEARREIEEMS
jgi:formate dehydrogenase iron-sulfur subunit